MHFKNTSHCSEKAFDLLLEIIGDVLPSDHTLLSTYYFVNKMVKDLKLSYDKIDACENDCILFYGDEKDKIVCDHCDSDRYKDVSGVKRLRKSRRRY